MRGGREGGIEGRETMGSVLLSRPHLKESDEPAVWASVFVVLREEQGIGDREGEMACMCVCVFVCVRVFVCACM